MTIDVNTEDLIGVTEAATRLRKSRNTVRRWLEAGRLEGFRNGDNWSTSREAIQRFADKTNNRRRKRDAAKRKQQREEAKAELRKRGFPG